MKPSDINILVVDDDPSILDIISVLFKSHQFNVDAASGGNPAWAMVQANEYHLVLTDVRMADGDGTELAKKIKAMPSSPSVLFMSGFTDLINEEIYHIGAEGKFTKPFDIKAVRTAIATCLLAPEVKWAQPAPVGSHIVNIEKIGKTVEELQAKKTVLFGRGGFFISHAFALPEKGSPILFSIEIEQPTRQIFKGAGVVRWIQNHGKTGIPPGVGVEITSMAKADALEYRKLFGKVTPFIPSPSRI